MDIKIAVLMTCHNRKYSTLECLTKLMAQDHIENIVLKVYLVDDGCTDGTEDAVRRHFPDIEILKGSGELYWGGGMRLAFGVALQENYDFYLWLNDDAILYPHAVRTMCDTSRYLKIKRGQASLVAGSMRDATTGTLTYGGSVRFRPWSPRSYTFVTPTDKPEPCDVVNGNFVLIPRDIVEAIGNLSEDFTHKGGDYDYSLRAQKYGFSSWIVPGYVGTCSRNSLKGSFEDNNLPLKSRVRLLAKPNVEIPVKEWMLFIKRHGGWLWPIYWLRALARMKFPWLWVLLRSRKVELH